jgi:hypothetical protein
MRKLLKPESNVNEEKLSEAKAKLLGIPFISLDTTIFFSPSNQLFPRAVAERFAVISVSL